MGPIDEQALHALPAQLAPFIIGKAWVCTITAGNVIQTKGTASDLPLEMRMYAIALCERLNREISFDGAWAVGWTDFSPADGFPKRLVMAYLDKDGDLIFTVDAEDPFLMMIAFEDDYINQCASAFTQAAAHAADVGVTPDQTIKAALGEESQDPDAEGDWITDPI